MNQSIKVLLVDDEVRFCQTMSHLLTRRGFDVAITNSAEDAIRYLKKNARDVVVLDMKMSGMDGIAALHEIKTIDPDIQVIILTGHGTKYSATRAFVREAFDYLAKPCDVDTLAARIDDAYKEKHHGFRFDMKKAGDIMTRIEEFETISLDHSVSDAVEKLLSCQHGILAVSDSRKKLAGILTMVDIMKALLPEYVREENDLLDEPARFSSIFWGGHFTKQVAAIAGRRVGEILSELPLTISENANLLEVAHLLKKQAPEILMIRGISQIIGIIVPWNLLVEVQATLRNPAAG
jgi:ActR/RegA family two-component response regulator